MNSEQIIVIELLAHKELKMFQEFIRNHWGKDHIFAKEASVFNWQHKGLKAYHSMVAKQNGDLVGVHGVIPLNHFDKHLPKNQIFIALWRVLEGKGIGIGLRIYKRILTEYKPDFIAGLNMNPRVLPFYERLGFQCDVMAHHVALSPFVKEFKVAKVPEDLMVQSQKKKFLTSFQKLTIKHLLDLKTDMLYLHQLPFKSDTYIVNRYMGHPVYRYEIYAISKDSMVQALCVIRPIFKEDSVVLSFVDYIGQNEAFPLLHDFILFLLKEYKAEYVDFYSYGLPAKLIQRAGFMNIKEVKNLIVPSYFEPFEKKNIDIRCGYLITKAQTPVRIFKGDGDADRPNAIQGS